MQAQANRVFSRCFIISCGAILVATAAAKFWGASLKTPILAHRDSLFYMNLRHLLWLTGTYEILLFVLLVTLNRTRLKLALISITGGQFVIYRLFKALVKDAAVCPCLGNVPESLGISQAFADRFLIGIACYFICGGILGIIYQSNNAQ